MAPLQELLDAVFTCFPEIESERLLLRAPLSGDEQALFRIYSNENVVKTTDFTQCHSVERATAFLEYFRSSFAEREQIRWMIVEKESQELIGTVSLFSFDTTSRRCEIGYDLAEAFWGKGFAREAVQRIVLWTFERLQMNRVEAVTDYDNGRSKKLLTHCGFAREGFCRARDFYKNDFHDGLLYAITARDCFWIHNRDTNAPVRLLPMTNENFGDIVRLDMKEPQKSFFAPNAYSIAQTTIRPRSESYGVYAGAQLVGFTMFEWTQEENSLWIHRLMIDASQQGKGFGRAAMLVLREMAQLRFRVSELRISVETENSAARKFTESLGFVHSGVIEDGKMAYTSSL